MQPKRVTTRPRSIRGAWVLPMAFTISIVTAAPLVIGQVLEPSAQSSPRSTALRRPLTSAPNSENFNIARGCNTIHVDASATGADNGTSWTDAFNNLQDALAAADVTPCDIWVADGTYMPDGGYVPTSGTHVPGSGDRQATFELIDGVGLYGGFAGGETSLDQRDIEANQAILSGDLGSNDAEVPCSDNSPDCDAFGGLCAGNFCISSTDNAENTYQIVTAGGGPAAVIDGFTITAGHANGSLGLERGGGINVVGAPTLANCFLTGNVANLGGGVYSNVTSVPTINNCIFSRNHATFDGGGMYILNFFFGFDGPSIIDCTFVQNSAGGNGGGIYSRESGTPIVTNSTFSGNSANGTVIDGGLGGGMCNIGGSSPIVTNCTFSANYAESSGAGMLNHGSDANVTSCSFIQNRANPINGLGGGMANGFGSAPTLSNSRFIGNTAEVGGGMSIITGAVPTLINCTFSGNFANGVGGGAILYTSSSPILTNCTINENSTNGHGGGLYNSGATPIVVTNSILWGNTDSDSLRRSGG